MNNTIRSDMAVALKKLMRKAEISRYALGDLRQKMQHRSRVIKVIMAILSLLLQAAIIIFYRDVFPSDMEELLIFVIAIVPALIMFSQNIEGIFSWNKKEKEYEIAICLWGQWIREASSIKKDLPHLTDDDAMSKTKEIEDKYVICMDKSPPIPSENFLRYKEGFIKLLASSKKLDSDSDSDG